MVIALYGFGIAYAGHRPVLAGSQRAVRHGRIRHWQLVTGANFPVTALPRALMVLGMAFPMTYAIDAMRALLLGTKPLVAVPLSFAIVIASMVAFLVLGRVVFDRIDAKVRTVGTLSTH